MSFDSSKWASTRTGIRVDVGSLDAESYLLSQHVLNAKEDGLLSKCLKCRRLTFHDLRVNPTNPGTI